MKKIMTFRMFAIFIFLASVLQANAPADRYTDETGAALNGGSVQVKDTVTGLIWQRAFSNGSQNWSAGAASGSAQLYCNQLIIGSHGAGSWRLPTVKELWTLLDVSSSSGATIDLLAFPSTPASYFWSSTAYQPAAGNAWRIRFDTGGSGADAIGAFFYARCVR